MTRMPARAGDRHRDAGMMVVLVALMLVVIMLMAAITLDVGLKHHRSSSAQRASDLAAMASVSELVRLKGTGMPLAQAERKAREVAEEVAAENGFDPDDADIVITTTFSKGPQGADRAKVDIQEVDLPLFFGRMFTDGMQVVRTSTATMSDCQAACPPVEIELKQSFSTVVDTAVGGDGWQPQIAGNNIFNIYHHDSGEVLYCLNKLSNVACGPSGFYPVEPYAGMVTNYTPKLSPDGSKVYFIVQTDSSVGLGCWDGATHSTCPSFATPVQMAAYKKNGASHSVARLDGPEAVGQRLFMYGDDNRMYCWDRSSGSVCAGYPKATSLAGVHDMSLQNAGSGQAGGVKTNGGTQFDMLVHPDGRIFTALDSTGDGRTWLSCWDTASDARCSGWNDASTLSGRQTLFFRYSAAGVPTGVCARAAKSGKGSGHACFTLSGASDGTAVTFAFDGKSGQQEASAPTSAGHYVTYFPMTGDDSAVCWDWTTGAACAIAPNNWSSTSDYAYLWDGGRCMIGLGHDGKMWSFGVDDGQFPCAGAPSGATARVVPCTCAGGLSQRWTAIVPTGTTEVSDFDSFTVSIRLPDGTLWGTFELTEMDNPVIELDALNQLSPMPSFIDIEITATAADGKSNEVFVLEQSGVGLRSGRVPTLVE